MKQRIISTLLLVFVITVLAILIPKALHAQPAGPGDWSKVRLFGHAFRNDDTTIRDTVAQHPDWVEEVRDGTVRWTYPNDAARNWWADTVDQLVQDSDLNGVFGDGAPGANACGQLESVESCLQRLSSFVIYNGYRVQSSNKCAAGASTLAHANGVFCEAFFRSSVETADEGVKLMEELLRIPSDKYIHCRGAGDSAFGSTDDFSLACYLIIANNYSFYSWGGVKNSYAADDSLIYWSDDFAQEIGKPLGKATKDGYAYHREFDRCSVDVNLETKNSSIVWKPVNRKTTPSKDEIKE